MLVEDELSTEAGDVDGASDLGAGAASVEDSGGLSMGLGAAFCPSHSGLIFIAFSGQLQIFLVVSNMVPGLQSCRCRCPE